MLSEAQYQSVLNFFYFLLLDEAMALSAALKAVKRIQKALRKDPENDKDMILIHNLVDVYERYRAHKDFVRTGIPPRSDWKVMRPEYLVAWKEFMRKAEPQFSIALVLRYILGFDSGVIARALAVPDGTIHFRLGRGLESLAQSSIIRTLVKR